MTKYLILIIFLSLYIDLACAASFYDKGNEYKGFYWFDTLDKKKSKQQTAEYVMPTPDQAAQAIESRKKQLDDARNQMVAVGLDMNAPPAAKRESIIAYKKLELEMWEGSLSMVEASDMANFTNPDLADQINSPTNVFGIKLQQKLEEKKNELLINQFAADYDLLLFAENSCPYCREFKPVLHRFTQKYGFNLEITDFSSKAGQIAASLGITSMPTVVAVKKDGDNVFEIARGMVSMSEIGQNIIFATRYNQEQEYNSKTKKIIGRK